jgi:hypothetical protein
MYYVINYKKYYEKYTTYIHIETVQFEHYVST